MGKKEKTTNGQTKTSGRKFLNLLKKISFTAYIFSLKRQITEEAAMSSAGFLRDNANIEAKAKRDIASFTALDNTIKGTSQEIINAPRPKSALDFVDNKGKTDAQLREQQVSILASHNKIDQDNMRDYANFEKEAQVYAEWDSKLDCEVYVYKKKFYNKKVISAITSSFKDYQDITSASLELTIKYGGPIKARLSRDDAAYMVSIFKKFNISATYYLASYAAAQKRALPDEEGLLEEFKEIAFTQRVVITALLFLLMLPFAIVVCQQNNTEWVIYLIIFILILAAVFGALWLISFLVRRFFVKIIYQIVKAVFRPMNNEYFPLATEYVISQIEDIYNPTMQTLTTTFVHSFDQLANNFNTHDKIVRSFLPAEVVDGNWIPFICKQMLIGASYNEAIWRAEQVQDREKWKQERRAREAKRDQEQREYRAKMLAEQERRTEYARLAEAQARQAAADASAAKSAAREAEKYEKEQKEILNQIRNDINRY